MYSGYWRNTFQDQGVTGYYWSSTQNTTSNTWDMGITPNYINPGTDYADDTQNGFAVRCITS